MAVALTACATGPAAMSVEEAEQVTATFGAVPFVPPPRTINEIIELRELERRGPWQWSAMGSADWSPPTSASAEELGRFYFRRADRARQLGRTLQAIDDYTTAAGFIKPGAGIPLSESDPADLGMAILANLGDVEASSGSYRRAIAHYEAAADYARRSSKGWLFRLHGDLARVYAATGDLRAAERVAAELYALIFQARSWPGQLPDWVAGYESSFASAQAHVLELRGRFADAEHFWRQSIAAVTPFAQTWLGPRLDDHTARLGLCLMRQGRLLEAEVEVRKALRSALYRMSLHTFDIPNWVNHLGRVLREQGRYAEAERLARIAISLYERTGSSPASSPVVTQPRRELAAILVAQGRWEDALRAYETLRAQLRDDALYAQLTGNDVSLMLVLVKARRAREAVASLERALGQAQRTRGDRDVTTAEIRGVLAMARGALGDRARALRDFAEAAPVLLDATAEVDDEATTRGDRDHRLGWILAGYIDLLKNIEGTPPAPAGVDPRAEAFRLADAARGRFVQRALEASAARSAAKTSALAALIRREQDAKKEIGALYGLVATASTAMRDPRVITDLQQRAETLRRARQTIVRQIANEFPAYAQLVHPPRATVEQVRAALRPGESLIATLVTEETTYMWAVRQQGPLAFAAVPLGRAGLEALVSRLRASLAPTGSTLGDVPAFDLAAAHALYRQLLEPVKAGWLSAQSLLVVAHGPLAQVPFGLLVTAPAALGPEQEPLFSTYRGVPWLVRSHAVTVLPSVTALATLRAVSPADPGRRPFVGFGDPYFSPEQTRRAAREPAAAQVAALAGRGAPLTLRDLKIQSLDSARLAILPRLPDTAEEIRAIAAALGADPARDVFLGERANERAVKTHDLAAYRVVAFATHGLVPGDLDGLTQPALALTAPEVAGVEGDGLLTMEEILALRLNADWVVLSACNTAAGAGQGAEAISGLGRAFFYAGARALLVSNWPVETTSARALTTELFRRQGAEPGLSRAKALQQTMLWLIDEGVFRDPATNQVMFSYAHPIFWAPFTLVGDGG